MQAFKLITFAESPPADRPKFLGRLGHMVLYALALLLVLLAPILGLVVAVVGAWHAVVAHSIIFLPLGLLVVLVLVSVYQRHGRNDLAMLALLLAGTASWFLLDPQTRAGMLEWATGLVLPIQLLASLLAVMVLLLGALLAWRFIADRTRRLNALDR